jgi:predicted nucleotidyltransferase
MKSTHLVGASALCQKYGIAELAVFGSVARGDAGPDSDVDLLYVRVPGNRVIRDDVLADAQVLYAA